MKYPGCPSSRVLPRLFSWLVLGLVCPSMGYAIFAGACRWVAPISAAAPTPWAREPHSTAALRARVFSLSYSDSGAWDYVSLLLFARFLEGAWALSWGPFSEHGWAERSTGRLYRALIAMSRWRLSSLSGLHAGPHATLLVLTSGLAFVSAATLLAIVPGLVLLMFRLCLIFWFFVLLITELATASLLQSVLALLLASIGLVSWLLLALELDFLSALLLLSYSSAFLLLGLAALQVAPWGARCARGLHKPSPISMLVGVLGLAALASRPAWGSAAGVGSVLWQDLGAWGAQASQLISALFHELFYRICSFESMWLAAYLTLALVCALFLLELAGPSNGGSREAFAAPSLSGTPTARTTRLLKRQTRRRNRSFIRLNRLVMLQKLTHAQVADRSGAGWVQVFHLYRGSWRRYAYVGGYVKGTVRQVAFYPKFVRGRRYRPLRVGFRVRGFVAHTKFANRFVDNTRAALATSGLILLKRRGVFKSKAIRGPLLRIVRKRQYGALFSCHL